MAAGHRHPGRPATTGLVVKAVLGPTWGLHLDDANLALGNLVSDVAAQERAFHA